MCLTSKRILSYVNIPFWRSVISNDHYKNQFVCKCICSGADFSTIIFWDILSLLLQLIRSDPKQNIVINLYDNSL